MGGGWWVVGGGWWVVGGGWWVVGGEWLGGWVVGRVGGDGTCGCLIPHNNRYCCAANACVCLLRRVYGHRHSSVPRVGFVCMRIRACDGVRCSRLCVVVHTLVGAGVVVSILPHKVGQRQRGFLPTQHGTTVGGAVGVRACAFSHPTSMRQARPRVSSCFVVGYCGCVVVCVCGHPRPGCRRWSACGPSSCP